MEEEVADACVYYGEDYHIDGGMNEPAGDREFGDWPDENAKQYADDGWNKEGDEAAKEFADWAIDEVVT